MSPELRQALRALREELEAMDFAKPDAQVRVAARPLRSINLRHLRELTELPNA